MMMQRVLYLTLWTVLPAVVVAYSLERSRFRRWPAWIRYGLAVGAGALSLALMI